MATELQDLRNQFDDLADNQLVLYIDTGSNFIINHLSMNSKIDKDTINTAIKYINGDSIFISFNRFVKTSRLISSIESGLTSVDSLNQELKSNPAFVYVEYTFIPDSEFNEWQCPPKIYEMKLSKTAECQLFKQKLREKHELADDDQIFVTDNWKSKIHREIRDHDDIADINRKSDDIFVYHKSKVSMDNSMDMKLFGDEDAKKYGTSTGKIVCVINNLKLEERDVMYYERLHNPNGPDKVIDEIAFIMPLLIRFIDKRAEMPMKELFKKLCKNIEPLINDEDLKRELKRSLNMKPEGMEALVFGYIRSELEQKFQMDMPMELKMLIMCYAKFDIEKELPFELRMDWGFNKKINITINSDEIVTFDKRNKKFQVIWIDVSKANDEYCHRKKRLPVDVDFE